jgi:uncharacterized membrane protein YraQ (UPF0718 family)
MVLAFVLPSRLNDFSVVFVSIILQSLPFLLVGVFASAFVQQYLSEGVLTRWLPRQRLPLVLVSSVFGFLAPVCDCGVIPLARRLRAKGVPLYAATTFILAAPVVNPVVLVATAFAFQGNWTIVALRFGMTLSVAITIGALASLLPSVAPNAKRGTTPPLGGADAEAVSSDVRPISRARELVSHATAEYFDVLFFIILGALFTAAAQAIVPRGDLVALGGTRVASVLVLMPVATLLSICSEADAFVARAFAANFSLGSVLAFMTIGQIVDLRNAFLLFQTLGRRMVFLIVVVSYALVFVEGVLITGILPSL